MISLLVTLIVLGVVFFFIEMLPLAHPFPTIVRVVAVLIALVVILNFLGIHILPLKLS